LDVFDIQIEFATPVEKLIIKNRVGKVPKSINKQYRLPIIIIQVALVHYKFGLILNA